jgi:hypothetical protein
VSANWWDDVIAEWESHPEWEDTYGRARGDFVMPGSSPRPKSAETTFIMEKYSKYSRALEARHDAQVGRQAGASVGVRRKPGRPRWTPEKFHAAYREALDRCAPDAGDKEIAAAMHRSYETFRKLIGRFGRPE